MPVKYVNGKEVQITEQEEQALRVNINPNSKDKLEKYLDQIRYEAEQGGITVNGLDILTRDRDKVLINGKIAEAMIKGLPDTDSFTFALNGKDFDMTIGALKAVGVAIAEHVQATVDAASVVRPMIADGTVDTLEAVKTAFDAALEA